MNNKIIVSFALATIVLFAGYSAVTSVYEGQKEQALEVATFECEAKIQARAQFYHGEQAKKEGVAQCLRIASSREK